MFGTVINFLKTEGGRWEILVELKIAYLLVVMIGAVNADVCLLRNTNSSPHPYLIRISKGNSSDIGETVAHGALISNEIVLSTCVEVALDDLQTGMYHLTGYNFAEKCHQTRITFQLTAHSDCNLGLLVIKNDFAFWMPFEAFATEGKPFLWGGSLPSPDLIKANIDSLYHSRGNLSMEVFTNVSIGPMEDVVDHGVRTVEIRFIPWLACSNNLNVSNVGNHELFCGIPENDAMSQSSYLETPDSYSGSVILLTRNETEIPLGLFGGEIDSLYWLIVAFTEEFFSFLKSTMDERESTTELNRTSDADCKLDASDRFAYMLRIIRFQDGSPQTVAHGSLLRPDRFLTTCTPFIDLPISLEEDPNWQIRGYNIFLDCNVIRRPSMIARHPDCVGKHDRGLLVNDFAIWSPNEDFSVEGTPYLWGAPMPPPISDLEDLIHALEVQPDTGEIGIFHLALKQRNSPGSKVTYVTWRECARLILGIRRIKVRNAPVWCAFDGFVHQNALAGNTTCKFVDVDWYSGAAVFFTINTTGRNLPLGMASRLVCRTPWYDQPDKLHLYVRFHEPFYDFFYKIMTGPIRNIRISTRRPGSSHRYKGRPASVVLGVVVLISFSYAQIKFWGLE